MPKTEFKVTHKLKEWRTYRGLTLAELGKKAKISASLISQLEVGRTHFSHKTLGKLAKALDCKDWELLHFGPEDFVWRPDPEVWKGLSPEAQVAYMRLMKRAFDGAHSLFIEHVVHGLVINSGSNPSSVEVKPTKRR